MCVGLCVFSQKSSSMFERIEISWFMVALERYHVSWVVKGERM